jgi:uncharacterized protein (DUF302 family)
MDRRTMLSVSGIAAMGGLTGCLGSTAQTDGDSGIVTQSVDDESVDAAVQRITEAIETNEDLSLVAELDHAANAATVDLELPPMVVLFFGNPAAGTPLIQESPTAGLDLPQRMLVWDDEGTVQVSYNDPEFVASRHGIEGQDERLGAIREALETIATGSTA